MSLCDILYFVHVLPALSSLSTLPGHVLGRCQKKSGQGELAQRQLGQLSLVPASAALCADVGISRVHLNRRFMKTMRHKTRDRLTESSRKPHRRLFCRWMTSESRDSTILSLVWSTVEKHCVFTIKFERSYTNLSLKRNWNSPVNRIPLLSL